jgi:hypothetical protein
MLCQLVCVDRRYQRMNCFNIRELQGNLKRKFFSDLVNSSDHRDFLDSTMIGLRFRTNNEFNIYHDNLTFHNLGITTEQKSRTSTLENFYSSSLSFSTMNFFNNYSSFSGLFSAAYNYFLTLLSLAFNSLSNFSSLYLSLSSMISFNLFTQMYYTLLLNFNFTSFNYNNEFNTTVNTSTSTQKTTFESNNVSSSDSSVYSQIGYSSNFRNNPFTNPIIGYDYKCGHYLGIWDKLYPSLSYLSLK